MSTAAPAADKTATQTEQQPQAEASLGAPKTVKKSLLEMIVEQGTGNIPQQYQDRLYSAALERDEFDEDGKLARIFARSGEFADLKNKSEEQAINTAMAKIQLGRSWGLGPADAMRFVYFTNGKPSLETDVVASRLIEAGWNWDIQWHLDDKQRCVGCTLWLKRLDEQTKQFKPFLDKDGKPVSVSFTKADADTAIIHENGKTIPLSEKWNYKSWPRDMYFSRCIGRVRRYHAPNVLRGGVTLAEAQDLTAEQSAAETRPPDNDPRWLQKGSTEAAQEVAEQKLAVMRGEAPPPDMQNLDDWPDQPEAEALGLWIMVNAEIFHRSSVTEKWEAWPAVEQKTEPKKDAAKAETKAFDFTPRRGR